MQLIPESMTDLGMGSLVESFSNGEPFTIVAYGWKEVTTKEVTDKNGKVTKPSETFPVLIVATDDGELFATRSGGLVHQWKQMEQKGLPEQLTVKLKAKAIEDGPAGASTWNFHAYFGAVKKIG